MNVYRVTTVDDIKYVAAKTMAEAWKFTVAIDECERDDIETITLLGPVLIHPYRSDR